MSTASKPVRAALYARVSTDAQNADNLMIELREAAERHGWTMTEYIDQGLSGAKESRAALDRLMVDAKRRLFDDFVHGIDGQAIRHARVDAALKSDVA